MELAETATQVEGQAPAAVAVVVPRPVTEVRAAMGVALVRAAVGVALPLTQLAILELAETAAQVTL